MIPDRQIRTASAPPVSNEDLRGSTARTGKASREKGGEPAVPGRVVRKRIASRPPANHTTDAACHSDYEWHAASVFVSGRYNSSTPLPNHHHAKDHLHSSAYEAPEVTITIVAIERGFATSGENPHEGESYDDDAFTSTSY